MYTNFVYNLRDLRYIHRMATFEIINEHDLPLHIKLELANKLAAKKGKK